tara:strand:+ start:4476 stop:5123 length:648 start_codon:yes stop_codon:yes gene_type:complete
LAKRLSEKEKEVLVEYFFNGKSIDKLAEEFECTKLTISRNLKRIIGEIKYKLLIDKSKKIISDSALKEKNNLDLEKRNKDSALHENSIEEYNEISTFTEIIPLDYEIKNESQKDLASIPLSEFDLPNIVYMIIDKKIELETRCLKDYPEWKFLPHDDLNRKTIEIFFDLNLAKRSCNKEQKVLKVPNTDVFRITAPILIEKGISRIVCAENLIAL